MAKSRGDSKLAVAGALTLVLAVAGVLLVKEPLRSSRPVGTGLEMKQATGEQLVRARLWEDPVAAVERAIREKGSTKAASATLERPSFAQRLRPLRQAIVERVNNGQRLTVLLVNTSGGPYVESTESRLRDRYAIGTALGVACYAPEDEGHLSFVEWEPQGPVQGLPYEWYRLRKTRVCGEAGSRADSVLVVWLPEEALSRGFFAALTSLSQALVCQETSRSECLLTEGKRELVRLNPAVQQAVTFKIMGPRSSSAYRALLDEAGTLYGRPHEGIAVWPNADGWIELYSPWASAMKGLLAYGLKAESGQGAVCATYEDCEREFYRRLADANVRLVYDIGSDDQRFEALIAELERRQVRLGWDAVILIGEWDSFYGRALPIEFRAAACARIATFSDADLKQIQVPVDIKRWCPTIPRAIDLQIQRPADYESLTLNVFRYSYLSGLDGEVPGDDAARASRAKTTGDPSKDATRDRPEGTSQLDYVRALVARIHDEGEGARAIGILGTDPYDALLIIKALRPAFPHAIFFTVDLDARHLHASEYKSTRNMVIASPFGLQLEGGLQRDVPPFRSSYQTSAYLAALQAVQHVVCRADGHGQNDRSGTAPCTAGYHVSVTPEDRIYDTGSHPRLFEVGRNGAVDLSVVDQEGIRTVHPLRADLHRTDEHGQLKQGVGFGNTAVAAVGLVGLLIGTIIAWSNQRLWLWVSRNPRLLGIVAIMLLASFAAFVAFGGAPALWANHDEGEPFSWTAGVSIWPSELIRLFVMVLCFVLLAKGSRDLTKNSDLITRDFRFQSDSGPRRFSLGTFWTNLQRVSHPAATMTATTVDQAWAWYREASQPAQWAARTLLLFVLYLGMMWSLGYFVLGEEYIHPCRGWLSCTVDWFMTLTSVALVVLINLAVFDAVMLCRRWIGWVTASTGGWSDQVQEEYLRDYGLGQAQKAEFEKLKYLAVVDLIGQRTEVVNRLIRYPFIALLIMIAGRNDYFDLWNYPLLLLFSWAVNVLLALLAAFLLYQAASKAKAAMLEGLSRQMVKVLESGKDHDVRMKQIQFIIDEVEANEQGAFVPLYQQPVIESSLYGLVALLQYLYVRQ